MLKMQIKSKPLSTCEIGTQTDLDLSRIPEDDSFTNKIDSNVFSHTHFNPELELKMGESDFEFGSNNKLSLVEAKQKRVEAPSSKQISGSLEREKRKI